MLEVSNISAFYGPSQALFDVSLEVKEGEVLAVMGRNGMGKTTTVKAICRMLPVAAGKVVFAGQDLSHVPTHRAARLGLGLVPEGRRCFAALSVRENLVAAARPGHWDLERVEALFPVLAERSGQRAGALSGGEQQMLAIARALMTNPKLLILDEATEGLAPLVRADIWSAIGQLKSQTGLSILVIDKSLAELSALADRATLLERGRDVWTGAIETLTPELRDRYLGV